MNSSIGAGLSSSRLSVPLQLGSVTPAVTSLAGGLVANLTGQGFGMDASISIAGVTAPILAVSDTVITFLTPSLAVSTACTDLVLSGNTLSCTSPAAPMPRPNGPVPATIMRAGVGYLMTSLITFEWADLWSRRSTWGGLDPPGPGDSVVIPTNTTVQGNLVWDELATSEVWLQASYIIVKGGNLSIGSDAVPYPGRARITLHGPPNSLELPLYGAKVLAVRDGHVNLHGQPKLPCWTQLAATVDVGDSTITLLGVVNWRVGDRLVIASSSLYAEDIDERTITAVTLDTASNTSMLTLDAPLTYTHLGEVVTVAGDDRGHRLDMRAEAFRLGSYSLHWHLHGDVAGKQYLKRSVITNTFNRAVTIHGTFGVLLSNNVAYNTMGHTFFLEDGIEQNNVIDGNLAILTRPSDALLNTDTSPASFWITNPNTTTVCPKFQPLGEFYNNKAHSNKFYGLRIHPE
ncbi:uncharacterized protein HaLaN_17904 [Haematococcus lacustris]|uniref:G8 domain-containing protein n=1 Tax=Haematococcus lacustris TaxID=44745 RepID=A0A699ZPU0_HAELA|nr:uncharacterized protein HaLaN_17904 [Haematococcus lacustris]